MSRTAAQQAMYPSVGVAVNIARNRAIGSGARARNSAVNQRSSSVSTIASIPPLRTLSMRCFHISGVPIFGAVLASTMRPMRSGACTPSHMPIIPPIDSPQKCARRIFSASSSMRTSRPSSPIVYGPGVTVDAPWPRVS